MATALALAPTHYSIGGQALKTNPHSVPGELIDFEQWVVWKARRRNGKTQKIPVDPVTHKAADVTDPSTWTDYTQAEQTRKLGYSGVGFVVTRSDTISGLDFDNCVDAQGRISPNAWNTVEKFNSYTELTPSGRGLRVLLEGTLPVPGGRIKGLEAYSSERFFTITGNHILATPKTIERRQEALDALYWQYLARYIDKPLDSAPQRYTDDVVIRMVVKADKYVHLWNGNQTGYASRSNADLALLSRLAIISRNYDQVERLFYRSAPGQRDKWQERADYRKRSILRAFTNLPDLSTPYVPWVHYEGSASLADELGSITGRPFVQLPNGDFRCIEDGQEYKPTCAYMSWHTRKSLAECASVPEPTFAVWRVRMLTDLGFVERPFVTLRPLPTSARNAVLPVYEGFARLLECKLAYANGGAIKSTTYALKFIMDWCNIGYGTAYRGLEWLLENDFLRRDGHDNKGNTLYLPHHP